MNTECNNGNCCGRNAASSAATGLIRDDVMMMVVGLWFLIRITVCVCNRGRGRERGFNHLGWCLGTFDRKRKRKDIDYLVKRIHHSALVWKIRRIKGKGREEEQEGDKFVRR